MSTSPANHDPPNIFDLYFKYMERKEPPQIFNRWSLLTCLGAALGRRYWLPFGEGRIFPNLYTILIGEAGSRKSVAINHAVGILEDTGYSSLAATKTSKEKFFMDLADMDDDPALLDRPIGGGRRQKKEGASDFMMEMFNDDTTVDKTPKEVLIAAGELNVFLGRSNIDFLTDLGELWDWDKETRPFEFRFKNSRSIEIWQPYISLLGGNNYEGFAMAFPPDMLGQGFLSRSILVFSEPSGRKETIPSKAPESLKAELVSSIRAMVSEVRGPAKITPKAMQALDVIYRTEAPAVNDIRFKAYNHRRFNQLLKLCLICSAAAQTTTIDEGTIVFANSILAFAEHRMPSALGQFGKAKNNDVGNNIISYIDSQKGVVTFQAIWKQTATALDKPQVLMEMLASMVQADQLVLADANGVRGYLVKKTMIDTRRLYTNFDLLKEKKA